MKTHVQIAWNRFVLVTVVVSACARLHRIHFLALLAESPQLSSLWSRFRRFRRVSKGRRRCPGNASLNSGSVFSHWGGVQQAAVELGPEEARVRVLLHQAVDDPLGVVEAEPRGRRHVPPDQLSGLVIDVDLQDEKLSAIADCDGAEDGVLPLWQHQPGCSF